MRSKKYFSQNLLDCEVIHTPWLGLPKMPPPKLIAVFNKFPRELFRVNNGRQVKLRVWSPKRRVYDIFADDGRAEPRALKPSTYVRE